MPDFRRHAAVRVARQFPVAATGLAILSAATLAYSYALANPFVYDDHRTILENTSLVNLADWRAILWHDVSRPVANLSYALDYAIWGGRSPVGFHLTNLLLHLANVLLVLRVGVLWARDRHAAAGGVGGAPVAGALTAGTFFALHPALTQAVGYVSARPELLCAFWLLLALLAGRRWMNGGAPAWAVASLSAWGLALASKEIAAVFPLLLPAYDRAAFGRTHRFWTWHVPLLAVAGAVAAVRLAVLMLAEGASIAAVDWRLALVEVDVFRRYVQLLVAPSGQTVFHAIAPVHGTFDVRVLGGLLVLLGMLGVGWGLRKREPLVAFGFAWFALLLAPSALLVMLDRGEPMAEHRLYAASAGFFLAAGALFGEGVAALATRTARVRPFATLTVILLALVCTVQTMTRTIVWRRPVSLWLEAAEYAPDHWLPRLALGEALHEAGRHDEAVRMLAAAVALRPSELLARAKLGQCQLEVGDLEAAERTFTDLQRLDPTSPAASVGLGLVAMQARNTSLARRYFLETLRQAPAGVPADSLAELVSDPRGEPDELLRWCEEVRRLAPATPGADDCIARSRDRLLLPGRQ